METTEIVKQAEGLANDEEKLMFLGKYLGDNLDVLEPRDFIQLLIPLVDITRRRYEQNTTLDTMTDYSIALTKLADYFIKNEQGWQATPLLIEAEELLREQPDLEENAEWKYNTYSQIGECYYANQRRLKAKDAYNIDLSASYMIGDSDNDVLAGSNAGCKCIKIERDGDLREAVDRILGK